MCLRQGRDLVPLRATTGDGHRHGRSTAVLTLADGSRAVYQPRPPTAHRHLDELRPHAALGHHLGLAREERRAGVQRVPSPGQVPVAGHPRWAPRWPGGPATSSTKGWTR
ncbi:DUF4135 domain-containing protein [Streptomyces sp. NPDC100445]|uniref:DUF4135 domain-containing protein n=1 Tax=Streptomyces sp. NPDC100445 TaxID=3366102 RepID=UPI003811B20B